MKNDMLQPGYTICRIRRSGYNRDSFYSMSAIYRDCWMSHVLPTAGYRVGCIFHHYINNKGTMINILTTSK